MWPDREVVDGAELPAGLWECRGDSDVETRLLHALVLSGALGPGEVTCQVPVGYIRRFGKLSYATGEAVRRKWIDLLHEGADALWVIEAKGTLDWSAKGQVLGYRVLLQEDFHPEKEVRAGIVCAVTDPLIARCCDEYGITVFVEADLA